MHKLCLACMESETLDSRVCVAAVGAAVGLIVYTSTESNQNEFLYLLPHMVKTLFFVLKKEKHKLAQKVLEEMIVLAGAKTGIFNLLIGEFFDAMLSIVENKECEEKTRELAIEFVVTVAEDSEQGCGMIEKLESVLITRLLAALMNMLLSIEDDKAWHEASSDDFNEGETGLFFYAMESLGRLAVALRGNAIVPNQPDFLPEFFGDADWKMRHAAVIAIRSISEGCSKVLKEHLGEVVEKILLLSRDPHTRVRWAAINAIGQFSKDLAPELQQKFHQQLVPELLTAMDDFRNPRVQAQAASAMWLFIQNCTSDVLKPYLGDIVSKLLEFMQKGKRMLKEGALNALASIASSMQEGFQEYYETVMPYLILLLKSENEESSRMLVSKAMECITMVGMAVGKEKFREDALQVVEVLISLQPSKLEKDDPMRRQLLQAWGRLCKCLGKDFLPYLTVSMPQLLQSAQLKHYLSINTSLHETDESDDESMEEGVTATIGGFGFRVYALEEKALACKMICCCAAELKGGLHLWISEVAQTLVPLLKFTFDEEVRSAAVTAMPLLLHSNVSAVEEGLHLPGFNEPPIRELPRLVIPALVEALNKEYKTEICAKILDSLNECMQISGRHLRKAQVIQFVDGLKEVLTASSFKKIERDKRANAADLGIGEWELLKEEIEQEEKVCDKIGSCLETLIKTFKTSFLPFFDQLLPWIAHMWGNDKTSKERKIALHIFHNIAEQCREDAFRYYDTCLPHLFKACNDKNPEVRQIVARGVGICAEFGGSVFKPHVEDALSCLEAAVNHPRAWHSNNVQAFEAAVSALGKVCYLHCKGDHEIVATWLKHLPIRNDLEEAKVAHDQLCSMIEQAKEEGFDPDDDNFRDMLKIFAEVLWAGNNLATQQTVNRMIKLLKGFLQKLQPVKLRYILTAVPLQHQNMLESILSS